LVEPRRYKQKLSLQPLEAILTTDHKLRSVTWNMVAALALIAGTESSPAGLGWSQDLKLADHVLAAQGVTVQYRLFDQAWSASPQAQSVPPSQPVIVARSLPASPSRSVVAQALPPGPPAEPPKPPMMLAKSLPASPSRSVVAQALPPGPPIAPPKPPVAEG
jgi:hypothetical protein